MIRKVLSNMLACIGYGDGGKIKKLGVGDPPLGWPEQIPWEEFAGVSRSKLTNQQITNIIISMLQAANINPATYFSQEEEFENEQNVDIETEDDGRIENLAVDPEALEIIDNVTGGDDKVYVDIETEDDGRIENIAVDPKALENIDYVTGGDDNVYTIDIETNPTEIEFMIETKQLDNIENVSENIIWFENIANEDVSNDGNKRKNTIVESVVDSVVDSIGDSIGDSVGNTEDNESEGEHSYYRKRKHGN